MNIDRVRLENFKCYADADLELSRGVTVVHGLNGSGKSSLLEAIFFALYGARAIERTLDEVVTIGVEETSVEVWFTHDGGDYHVRRRVRATGDRAQTVDCVLEGPDRTVDGARDVRAAVASLLRMDSAAFLNCAYVRQGEVNTLIEASPSERQDMIDDLLQLGVLEEYRERAIDARRAVQRVRDGRQEVAEDLAARIQEKADADLQDRVTALESELNEVDDEIERYEQNREEAEDRLEEARSILENHEERRAELSDLEEEIDALESAIQETVEERDDLAEAVATLRSERDRHETAVDRLAAITGVESPTAATVESALGDVADELEELRSNIEEQRRAVQGHETEAENAADRADDLEARAADRATSAEEAAEAVDELDADLAERRADLDDVEAEIEAAERELEASAADPTAVEAFVAAREATADRYRERVTAVEADLEAARDRVAEAEELLEAGRCPACGQPVEDSPHVDALEQRRDRVETLEERLAGLRTVRAAAAEAVERAEELREVARTRDRLREEADRVADRIADLETSLEERREQVEEHRSTAEDLRADAEAARETAATARAAAAEAREAIGEYNEAVEAHRAREARLESLAAALDAVEDVAAEIDRLEDRRSLLAEQNDERRERLTGLRDQRRELAAAVDDQRIEDAEAEVDRAASYLEEVTEELEGLRDRRDELIGQIQSTRTEIRELEELRDRRETVAERVDRLDGLVAEVEQLEAAYGQLRGELRQRNVDTLERMLNETFELVYGNDSYDRIELSEAYELTVYQKDGVPLDPEQLSGGERALFNLSLRAAIYRLLAEGVEGAAPMPPFVLDEPTVYLDTGHVSRLVELIETMRTEVGVDQILVVSHDEELVAAAESVVHVEKDPTTNRSHVEKRVAAAD